MASLGKISLLFEKSIWKDVSTRYNYDESTGIESIITVDEVYMFAPEASYLSMSDNKDVSLTSLDGKRILTFSGIKLNAKDFKNPVKLIDIDPVTGISRSTGAKIPLLSGQKFANVPKSTDGTFTASFLMTFQYKDEDGIWKLGDGMLAIGNAVQAQNKLEKSIAAAKIPAPAPIPVLVVPSIAGVEVHPGTTLAKDPRKQPIIDKNPNAPTLIIAKKAPKQPSNEVAFIATPPAPVTMKVNRSGIIFGLFGLGLVTTGVVVAAMSKK